MRQLLRVSFVFCQIHSKSIQINYSLRFHLVKTHYLYMWYFIFQKKNKEQYFVFQIKLIVFYLILFLVFYIKFLFICV